MSAAAVAATVIIVSASELMQKKKRRPVRKLFQRRASMGCYCALVRELRDKDPEAFRGFLRMDIETFDTLLALLEGHVTLNDSPSLFRVSGGRSPSEADDFL